MYLFFSSEAPFIRDAITTPVHVQEGEDALLTCVVREAGDNVVLWKKQMVGNVARILTAGNLVTALDSRYSVLHDNGKFDKTFVK